MKALAELLSGLAPLGRLAFALAAVVVLLYIATWPAEPQPAQAAPEPIRFACDAEAQAWTRFAAALAGLIHPRAVAEDADTLLRSWRARGGGCPSAGGGG